MKKHLFNLHGIFVPTHGIPSINIAELELTQKQKNEINFCLNCDSEKCSGICYKLKEFRRTNNERKIL